MQAEEAEARRERWGWAEPSVWTDRMLAALENGVKGGKWNNAYFAEHGYFSLYDAYVKARQSV
jgi:RNA-directed DNA polymerase